MLKKICLIIAMALPCSSVVVANDLYNTPIRELREVKGVDAADVRELFVETLEEEELAVAIKENAPEVYEELLEGLTTGYNEDQTVADVVAEFMPIFEAMLMKYLPYGDDKALLMFSETIAPIMAQLRNQPDSCRGLLTGNAFVATELAATISDDIKQTMSNAYILAFETYDEDRIMPLEDEVMPNLLKTMTPVMEKYGAELFVASQDPTQVKDGKPCLAMGDLYENINDLPTHDAAELLRFMLVNGQ